MSQVLFKSLFSIFNWKKGPRHAYTDLCVYSCELSPISSSKALVMSCRNPGLLDPAEKQNVISADWQHIFRHYASLE